MQNHTHVRTCPQAPRKEGEERVQLSYRGLAEFPTQATARGSTKSLGQAIESVALPPSLAPGGDVYKGIFFSGSDLGKNSQRVKDLNTAILREALNKLDPERPASDLLCVLALATNSAGHTSQGVTCDRSESSAADRLAGWPRAVFPFLRHDLPTGDRERAISQMSRHLPPAGAQTRVSAGKGERGAQDTYHYGPGSGRHQAGETREEHLPPGPV